MNLMLPFDISYDAIKNILILVFGIAIICFIFLRGWSGIWASTIRNYFVSLTFITIGAISVLKSGGIDSHAIMSTSIILIPAVIVMGILGHEIGSIMDNPKNRDDADYKLDVLNALKRMDKSITLDELNEKLTKTAEEPDIQEEETEENTES